MSDADALKQIQDRLSSLQEIIKRIGVEHSKAEPTISSINKIHEKGRESEKLTQATKTKLRSEYGLALEESEREESVVREALEKIYEIRTIKNERKIQAKLLGGPTKEILLRRGHIMKMLNNSAAVLPLWIGKNSKETPPPLCGAIPPDSNYIAKLGDMVAALVRSGEGDENWILAEVNNYNISSGKYELDDIDEEQKEVLSLPKKSVLPLPLMRANPETNPEALFQKDTIVLALYPQTTCFYKAVVTLPPRSHSEEYEVQFEDSTYSEGYSPGLRVPQRYVIAHPLLIPPPPSTTSSSNSLTSTGQVRAPRKKQTKKMDIE